MTTINCLGEMCPMPSMRLRKALIRAKPGEEFVLVTDHSCVPQSISDYCAGRGLVCTVEEIQNGVWELKITC